MKKIKSYFHLIFKAVICMLVNLFSGKNAEKMSAKVRNLSSDTAERNVFGMETDMCEENAGYPVKYCGSGHSGRNCYIKKIFFWLQGPGDRIRVRAGTPERQRKGKGFCFCVNNKIRETDIY